MLHSTQLLSVFALAATAVAQVGWTQSNPATRPSMRGYHWITYDVTRGVTVLFGGWNGGPLNDTWEWSGVNWTQRVTPTAPPARCGNGLAVDMGRARVVLFGGTSASNGGDKNDTWEFDGSAWTQLLPANQPSLRRFVRMEYDAVRGRIVLFGGGLGGTGVPTFNDTWEWDGVDWTLRSPATSPPVRWAHGMTYDFARARIVLFGGSPGGTVQLLNDTWTWDGTNWTPVTAASSTPTTGLGLANDATHDLVVRFGGVSAGLETWLFDHVGWRQDSRTPTAPGRTWCSLAHDLLRGRTVLFGGSGGPYLDDTWEYDPGTVARWTAYGSGCAGTAGLPALRPAVASLPIVGTTFQLELLGIPGNAAAISFGFSDTQWNGGALPFGLGALGMTGCTLHASPDFVFFAPVVAGRATLALPLPNDPSLTGTRFFSQGFVLDPGVNPLGATVSNAGAGTIGPF